jgi:hypothetical protein
VYQSNTCREVDGRLEKRMRGMLLLLLHSRAAAAAAVGACAAAEAIAALSQQHGMNPYLLNRF